MLPTDVLLFRTRLLILIACLKEIMNQKSYLLERYVTIGDERVLFNDGSHILYVNGKYRGDDEIGKLMYDFSCTNPDDMNFEALAKRARYFKQDEKGVATMCKMMEDMRNEANQCS